MHRSEQQYGSMTVALSGELDHCNAAKIRTQLDQLLEDEDLIRLCLDLEGLSFMDSSGIGVMLGRQRILEMRGGTLSVKNMSKPIERLFYLSGMDRLIEVEKKEGGRV